MPRYNEEVKAEALKKISEIGVQKTHEETGINVQTLYQWRRKAEPVPASETKGPTQPEQQKIAELLKAQADLTDQLEAARQENAKLSKALADANARRAEETTKFKDQIRTMRKVIDILMAD